MVDHVLGKQAFNRLFKCGTGKIEAHHGLFGVDIDAASVDQQLKGFLLELAEALPLAEKEILFLAQNAGNGGLDNPWLHLVFGHAENLVGDLLGIIREPFGDTQDRANGFVVDLNFLLKRLVKGLVFIKKQVLHDGFFTAQKNIRNTVAMVLQHGS